MSSMTLSGLREGKRDQGTLVKNTVFEESLLILYSCKPIQAQVTYYLTDTKALKPEQQQSTLTIHS